MLAVAVLDHAAAQWTTVRPAVNCMRAAAFMRRVNLCPGCLAQRTSARTMAPKNTLWELCTAIPIQAL